MRVGEGKLHGYSWTTNGDGFVTLRSSEDVDESLVQWYSYDAVPERSLRVPKGDYVSAVGRDAALYVVRHEDSADVFVAPRQRGEPRLLLSGYFDYDVRVSPDGGRCVLLATVQGAGEQPVLVILTLPDGEPEHLAPPSGHEDADKVGILGDGSLVWTTGERPTKPNGERTTYDAEIPPEGTWPSPEERVDVWVWDPHSEGSPVRFYDAGEVWLDWRMSVVSDRLLVCRIAEDAPPRREFVELVLTGDGPQILPGRKERWSFDNRISPDGRFAVRDIEDTFPQTRIDDLETGQSRRLGDTCFLGMGPRLLWSPTGHRFLYETVEQPFLRLRWKGTIADEEAQPVVRLVDLAE